MKTLLSVENVSLYYQGVRALEGANLSVEEGSITGLIGPNGAGKTTLFNSITGYARASSGTIVYAGVPIQNHRPWQIARLGLARTFQTAGGFPGLTVWENLMVAGAGEASESLLRSLAGKRFWLHDERRVDRAAHDQLDRLGILSLRDTLLADVAGHDARLVEIARQLMTKPKLLLLDEPAAGFGPEKLSLLSDLIVKLNNEGVTILIIEHNIRFILGLASKAFVLAAGRTIFEGPSDRVSSDETVRKNYLGAYDAAA